MGVFAYLGYFWPGLLARRNVEIEVQHSLKLQAGLLIQPNLDMQANSNAQRRLKMPDGQITPILDRLFPELIIYTARLMPLYSAASWALSCHYVYDLLGPGYWKSLRTQDQREQRVAFLALLERDLPHHIVCHGCQKLHDISKYQSEQIQLSSIGRYAVLKHRSCHRLQMHPVENQYISIGFRFDDFQMATKFYRTGIPYNSVLRWADTRSYWVIGYRMSPEHYRARSKIVDGSVFVRVQYSYLIPDGLMPHIPPNTYSRVCPHTSIKDLSVLVLGHVMNGVDKQTTKRSGLIQCWYCPTEYQLDLQIWPRGILVVVTKWLDIGEGRASTDFKWRSHLIIGEEQAPQTVPAEMETYLQAPGSIRDSFERSENENADPFSSQKETEKLYRHLEDALPVNCNSTLQIEP